MRNLGIIAGHSHVFAFGVSPPAPGAQPVVHPIKAISDKTVFGLCGDARRSSYWDALIAHARDRTVFLLWHGNQHLSQFLFAPEPLFDFYRASAPSVAVDLATLLVPENLVRARFDQHNEGLRNLLTRLHSVPNCKPVIVGTPPPKGDDQCLRLMLRSERRFAALAAERNVALETIPLTPPWLRRKLWHVVQDLLREIAEDHGCSFIPVASDAMCEAGFLKKIYWAKDVTHANTAYGALMWNRLLPMVAQ